MLGDFNAKLDISVQKFGKGSINENGFLLSEAMLEAKHTATNTKFRHKYCNITTWKSNTIKKKIFNQIDYITEKINY